MTFDDLMNCCEDNKYNFRNLMKCLNANSIIPVFGSGISANLYPTWRNLLIKIAHKQGIKKEVNNFLNTDELEDAAEYIYNYMNGNRSSAFYRQLEDIFNPEDFNLAKLPEELKLIPAIFKNSIMTLNFDVVLEKIFESEKINIEKVFLQSEFFKTRIDSSLPKSERLLIKLHGDIRYKNSLIFTKSSYDEAYGETNIDLDKIMPKMLKDILESKVILFIGCGLKDDRIMKVLECCSSNATYYALIELPKETVNKGNPFEPKLRNNTTDELIKAYQDRKNYIDRHNIIPIWFPYEQYDAVPVFLKELANQSSISIKKKLFS